jgi:hypothetical protein
MSDDNEKRMIADTGYEVKQAIHLGDREILLAENMNEPEGSFYMKAEYTNNGLIGQYDHIIYSSTYLAIMEEFVGSVARQITSLRNEIINYAPMPIIADKCYPHDYGEDLNGKVVAIKADVLRPEYRRADMQMVLVDGGSGARGDARGSAVFCQRLCDGKHTRFERYDVLGVIKELPDWAQERLAAIQAEREVNRQPKPAAPETVAGYTVTERVQVGEKLFVLGENPGAVSPFATWRHTDGREGYDVGHYFQSREKAMADLHRRAEKERDGQVPDKAKRNRDDAR